MLRKILILVLGLCFTPSLWAGCGGYSYKGDSGYSYKGDSSYNTYSRNTGDGCAGSLNCVEPLSRMSCTDPYCFYPPEETMSQARCCHEFGNMGDTHNNNWGSEMES